MKRLLEGLFWWLLAIGLTVGGAYTAYWGISQEALARSSLRWPSVTGQITSSYVQVSRNKTTNHFPKVRYRYTVNGEGFLNDRIYFGSISSREDEAADVMEKYPQGKYVPVHYNPNAFRTSCLEPGRYRDISALSVMFGFTIFMAGSLMLLIKFVIFGLRRSTKTS